MKNAGKPKEYVYSEHTYNSSIPIQRLAHRKRFKISLALLDPGKDDTCLDFGCGDGKFLLELTHTKGMDPSRLYGFDPYTPPLKELSVTMFKDYESTLACAKKLNGFSIVTCFEVLEHFSPKGQEEQIRNILSLLSANGKVIVSVPIEVFLPALVKGTLRKVKYKHPDFTIKNILLSFIGRAPLRMRHRNAYISHMGFDYRHLEKLFRVFFEIEKKTFSPFPGLGATFNSQVFFVLRPKQ
jgi:SAM-dependent methyltransferase